MTATATTIQKYPAFHVELAEKVIENLTTHGSLYSKGWINAAPELPFNPVSSNRYRGGNLLNLLLTGMINEWNDPRWMTYRQAQENGFQVRPGEKGSRIVFVQSTRQVPELDDKGQVICDAEGKPKTKHIQLQRPFVRHSFVFNGTQIDGLTPLHPRAKEFEPVVEAEKIIFASGATLHHDQLSRAFYSPTSDSIHLPQRHQFLSAENYYATALHELCHWTGHESRLARLSIKDNPYGSEGYAREELRAEIGSLLLTKELGITDDHSRSVGYLSSWVEILKEHPLEILNACSDAEKIRGYIMDFAKELSPSEATVSMNRSAVVGYQSSNNSKDLTTEKTVLAVPYKEKDEAKAVARSNGFSISWDKETKTWFAPKGVDITPLAKWVTGGVKPPRPAITFTEDPVRAFGESLRSIGISISDPIMDGTIHRAPLEGDSGRSKNGAYIGGLDGIPGGWGKNHKTGEEIRWRATPETSLSDAEYKRLLEVAEERQHDAAANRLKLAQEVAASLKALIPTLKEASPDHPYLVKKGVTAAHLLQDDKGNLAIPLSSIEGEITSLQRITTDGTKLLEKGGTKKGSFFSLSADKPLTAPCIVIAEGLATAKSVEASLSDTKIAALVAVVMAVDAHNMIPVAEALHEKYPGARIAFAADRDTPQPGETLGVGQLCAEEAAKKVGGIVLVPEFKTPGTGTDFNDLATVEGLSTVTQQIAVPISKMVLSRDVGNENPVHHHQQVGNEPSYRMRGR